MRASDRLMNLNVSLQVFKDINDSVCVEYERSFVIGDGVEIGTVGRGSDFEKACEDYLNKISGKKLRIYDPYTNDRREVTVL